MNYANNKLNINLWFHDVPRHERTLRAVIDTGRDLLFSPIMRDYLFNFAYIA